MKKNERSAASAAIIFLLIGLLLSVCCIVMGAAAERLEDSGGRDGDVDADAEAKDVRVVIDAGHGGEDGGAVGVDGTLEKDLNLSLAKMLYSMLSASGIRCEMTRDDDRMLYDMYGDDWSGKKKLYDLKNRLRFAEEYGDAVFVSIHMNSFGINKYSGLQVYYSPNDSGSLTMAEAVQTAVREYIQPENARETKRAGDNIFILDRINQPAILVECGFISNPGECAMLGSDIYRQKLAAAIGMAIAEYISDADI